MKLIVVQFNNSIPLCCNFVVKNSSAVEVLFSIVLETLSELFSDPTLSENLIQHIVDVFLFQMFPLCDSMNNPSYI